MGADGALGVLQTRRLRRAKWNDVPHAHARSDFANWQGMKRAVDLVMSASLLVLFAPFMFLIWITVIVTSDGPGLHWSERVGRDGQFRMPKFRTMAHGSPLSPRESLANAGGHITVIGGFLRRWALDELPQLWSILRGDMSFIGPRPLLASDPASMEREKFPVVAEVRPGLSGLAQVAGRNRLTPRRKALFDALYARKCCAALDAQILLRRLNGFSFTPRAG